LDNVTDAPGATGAAEDDDDNIDAAIADVSSAKRIERCMQPSFLLGHATDRWASYVAPGETRNGCLSADGAGVYHELTQGNGRMK
jgi:hypothetical protein